jgi:hypothetical protein
VSAWLVVVAMTVLTVVVIFMAVLPPIKKEHWQEEALFMPDLDFSPKVLRAMLAEEKAREEPDPRLIEELEARINRAQLKEDAESNEESK